MLLIAQRAFLAHAATGVFVFAAALLTVTTRASSQAVCTGEHSQAAPESAHVATDDLRAPVVFEVAAVKWNPARAYFGTPPEWIRLCRFVSTYTGFEIAAQSALPQLAPLFSLRSSSSDMHTLPVGLSRSPNPAASKGGRGALIGALVSLPIAIYVGQAVAKDSFVDGCIGCGVEGFVVGIGILAGGAVIGWIVGESW
jgi:hypothetical protein